eukprot:1192562-Pleurochrysis_carterae.AAC.1
MYYTSNYTTPDIVSAVFDGYTAGTFSSTVYNAYTTNYGNAKIPWLGKHIGTQIKNPDDDTIVLTNDTGDISTHAHETLSTVFKYTVTVAGSYELHDTFALPTRSGTRVALSVM